MRDHERSLDIQQRVTDDGFLAGRIEHPVYPGGVKPWIGDHRNFDSMRRVPIWSVDNLNNTLYPETRLVVSFRIVVAELQFVQAIDLPGGVHSESSEFSGGASFRVNRKLRSQGLPVVIQAPCPEKAQIDNPCQISQQFPTAPQDKPSSQNCASGHSQVKPRKRGDIREPFGSYGNDRKDAPAVPSLDQCLGEKAKP